MIVLFSHPGDNNTNYLIEWLHYYQCKFVRVDLENEDFKNINIIITNLNTNITLKLSNNNILNFEEVDFFFVRGVGFTKPKIINTTSLPNEVFNSYIDDEFESLTNFFYSEVNKKSVGYFYNDSILKLKQLVLAKKAGLLICNSLITNNKQCLIQYYNNTNVITKAIEDNIGEYYDGRLIIQRVQKVNYNLTEDYFFPSFFQNEIQKDMEIRTFFLAGVCYSISIKYSSDSIDMRDNYDIADFEPYKLPQIMENKIKIFMNSLNLISGSLDFIKSNNKYYFLEINPNGQYDWVSHFGHYNLHQKIGEFLKSQIKEK